METETLAQALTKFCRAHHKLAVSQFRRHEISPGQPPVLDYLSRNDGCIQNDLSKSCRLEPATITALLSNMERDGLVERRPNAADRRVWQVSLTPEGRARHRQLESIQAYLGEESLKNFSQEEQALLWDFVCRMTQNLHDALTAQAAGEDSAKGDEAVPC